MKRRVFLPFWIVAVPSVAFGGEADVVAAEAAASSSGYRFEVTVRHDDAGWDHYADRFEVLSPEGDILGTRVLHHPHVNEQPFTRSLGGVDIPAGIVRVRIRAHDSVHGPGGAELEVGLPPR